MRGRKSSGKRERNGERAGSEEGGERKLCVEGVNRWGLALLIGKGRDKDKGENYVREWV